MPEVTVNAARINYEEQGSGDPIIFVHGLWMSSRFFANQLSHFGMTNRAIAVDLRGHGRSEHTAGGHTVANYARDLRALIEELDLTDAVLVGWSMGAMVVWEYQKQFGDSDLKGTVVVDQSASDLRTDDWPLGFADLPTLAHFMAGVQTDRAAVVQDFIPLLFKDPPSPEDLRWMTEEITRVPESIASAVLFDQTVQDYRPDLAGFKVPTLLCFGRDEKLIPVALGQHLEDTLPDARLVVFEHSGHCPFLEEPARFNETVDEFITGLA
jgi:pimeloyl-ACP methyl ester carboxylesterase